MMDSTRRKLFVDLSWETEMNIVSVAVMYYTTVSNSLFSIIFVVTQPSKGITFDTVTCPTPDANYTLG